MQASFRPRSGRRKLLINLACSLSLSLPIQPRAVEAPRQGGQTASLCSPAQRKFPVNQPASLCSPAQRRLPINKAASLCSHGQRKLPVNLFLFAAPRCGTPYHPSCLSLQPKAAEVLRGSRSLHGRSPRPTSHSLHPCGKALSGLLLQLHTPCTLAAAPIRQVCCSSLAQIPPAAPLRQGCCSS